MSAFVIKLSQQNVHMLACARRLISERGAIVEHNQKKGEGVLVEMHRNPRLSVNVFARRMQNKKKLRQWRYAQYCHLSFDNFL